MLTWNELKQLVDKALEENGKDGEIRISFINLGLHDTIGNTEVLIEEDTLQVF